jgi:hypothetical protein
LLVHLESSRSGQDAVIFGHLELIIVGVASVFFEQIIVLTPPEGIVEHIFVNGTTQNSVITASTDNKVSFLALFEHVLDVFLFGVIFFGVFGTVFLFDHGKQLLLRVLSAIRLFF